ncbi:MAG: tol-pal system protein YbgF [Holosporales bacterium]|jgi:tol-pal system protein YbgF
MRTFGCMGMLFGMLMGLPALAQQSPGLVERQDGLEREQRALTDTTEQLRFRLEQVERRLQTLEGAKANTPSVVAPLNPPVPAPGTAGSTPTVPATDVAADPSGTLTLSATELYNEAFTSLRQQDYLAAERGFTQFLTRFPKDNLASNSRYWLAETFYVRGDYTRSAEEFLTSYRTFPKASKAAESLAKLGLSLAALGNKPDACRAYGRFAKEYPDASEALRQRVLNERKNLDCP